jgi:hypothetical protein
MYMDLEKTGEIDKMLFMGRSGRFVPVEPGSGGGILYRVKDDKTYAVTGTKGYEWMDAGLAEKGEAKIDWSYYHKLAEDAQKAIEKYGSFEEFVEIKEPAA